MAMTLNQADIDRAKRARNIIKASSSANTYDKSTVIKAIKDLLPSSKLLSQLKREFEAGEIILAENQQNHHLFIIVEGTVSQMKSGAGLNTAIDYQGAGDFIGLLSFQTGQTAFTTAKATTPVTTLAIDHKNFELFHTRYPEISKVIQGLIFSNLSDRYRRVVTLHVEVALLSKQLEQERNQLQNAIQALEKTRNALISQEKMATLGELTAGLAHEINNPASALFRSVDYLINSLPGLAERAAALPDNGLVRFFFEEGFKRRLDNSRLNRKKQKELADEYPELKRSFIRLLSEMSPAAFDKIKPFITSKHQEHFHLLLDVFQSGSFLESIKLSTARIEYLVKSLKSYSRQSGSEPEVTDIRTGIKETLQILGSRLQDVQVETKLPEIPPVLCFIGELNQVWTNIIINACEAMNDNGKLFISCGSDEKNVWVKIADTGPGVPDLIKNRIFDSSFTTKTAGGDFGLGIGLAISKGVVEKHNGTVKVTDREGGGAEFLITLPAHTGKK